MKTVLVITSYTYEGKNESFSRAYLPTEEASAVEQAQEFWTERHMKGEAVSHTAQVVTPELLRKSHPDRAELILSVARVCALSAVEAGAPPIPEGLSFGAWREGKDAFEGDYDFLGEALAFDLVDATRADFKEAYLQALFELSEAKEYKIIECGASDCKEEGQYHDDTDDLQAEGWSYHAYGPGSGWLCPKHSNEN